VRLKETVYRATGVASRGAVGPIHLAKHSVRINRLKEKPPLCQRGFGYLIKWADERLITLPPGTWCERFLILSSLVEPELLLLADGEPRGTGIGFQCEHDGIALRYYAGAGTSLEGTGATTIQVMVGQASQSATAADTRGTVATFREPRASLLESILLDADRTGKEAEAVVTGSGNQRHHARFDLTGMEENMKRLPCSL